MLQSYLPVIVFVGLGLIVGGALVSLNHVLGPRRPNKVKSEPYECGLPSEVFDIEVVFLYPVAVILQSAESVFVLVEIIVFVVLLVVAFVYAWRRGALDWR